MWFRCSSDYSAGTKPNGRFTSGSAKARLATVRWFAAAASAPRSVLCVFVVVCARRKNFPSNTAALRDMSDLEEVRERVRQGLLENARECYSNALRTGVGVTPAALNVERSLRQVLASRGAKRISPEQFQERFGHLPQDAEG